METIDFGDFNLNDTGAVKAPPPEPQAVKITTRKADASLVQKELTSKKKSEPEIQKHQELTLMLSRYGTSSRFGDYLKSLSFELTPAKLRKQKVEKLEELLERVRTSVANKTVSDIWSSSIMTGVSAVESICSKTKINDTIKLKGLSEVLSQDENWLDLMEELKLNNQNLAYVSPYTRIAYTLLTSIMHVHGVNTLMDKRNKASATPAQPQAPQAPQAPQSPTDDEKAKKISTKKVRVDRKDQVYDID